MIKLFENFDIDDDVDINYISDILSDIYYDGLTYKIWVKDNIFDKKENKARKMTNQSVGYISRLRSVNPLVTVEVGLDSDHSSINHQYRNLDSRKSIMNETLVNSFKSLISYMESYSYIINKESYFYYNGTKYYFNNLTLTLLQTEINFICLKFDKIKND